MKHNSRASMSHNVEYSNLPGEFLLSVPLSRKFVKPVDLGLWRDCREYVDRLFRLVGILDDVGVSYEMTLHFVHNSGISRYIQFSRFRNVADELRVCIVRDNGEDMDCTYFRPYEIHSERLRNYINSFFRSNFSHCGFTLTNCRYCDNKDDAE